MSAILYPVELTNSELKSRHVITGNQPTILSDIYQDETNIVIWQRKLTGDLVQTAEYILKTKPNLQASFTVTLQNTYASINDALGTSQVEIALVEDIVQLVDMFCYLFNLKHVGLRLTTLDSAMCPRFHVDRVPCRLVTTYFGKATQWIPHHLVNRSKLGPGNQGKPNGDSGLFKSTIDVQQLSRGDVALLKGELWDGNEGAGLVHRSPELSGGEHRLLLTLDFID